MALTKEQMQAIDSYGDRIKTLKDFVTAVRLRYGMYLGEGSDQGFENMMREIIQNSIDQLVDPQSPCNWFSFEYDERTTEVTVCDNGLGFPPEDILRILTSQHTSKNFEKKPGEYSSGLNGVGAKIVNALSTVFIVESYKYDGTAVRMEFKDGYAVSKGPIKIPNKEKRQGSMVYFIPDQSIIGELHFEWKRIYTLIKHLMSMTPIGSHMDFKATDYNGKCYTEKIINKDGIVTDLIMKMKKPIIKPIRIFDDDGVHRLETAFCYDISDESGIDYKENITAFSNMCPTRGGTHIEGTIEGICRWFTQYMNNIYLANQKAKDKLKIIANDIKNGLNVMIAAAHLDPVFSAQQKDVLSNPDMQGFCKDVVMRGLDEWSKANPQDLAKLSKFFKEMAELRIKEEGSRAKIVKKYDENPLSGLPDKYIRPKKNKNIELIIVEGDSAKGTVQLGRDPDIQGIFPIRGKIINAFKASKEAFFSNEEVQAITRIIVGPSGYKRNFDPSESKVDKIIFMADR